MSGSNPNDPGDTGPSWFDGGDVPPWDDTPPWIEEPSWNDEPADDEPGDSLPAPAERAWRHPSEIMAAAGAASRPVAAPPSAAHASAATLSSGRLTLGSFVAPTVVVAALAAIWIGASQLLPTSEPQLSTSTSIPGIVYIQTPTGPQAAVVDESGLTAVFPTLADVDVSKCHDSEGRPLQTYRIGPSRAITLLIDPLSPAPRRANLDIGDVLDSEAGSYVLTTFDGQLVVEAADQVPPGFDGVAPELYFGGVPAGWRGEPLSVGLYVFIPR